MLSWWLSACIIGPVAREWRLNRLHARPRRAMLRVFVRLVFFVTAKRRDGAADRRIVLPTGRWSQSIAEAT